MVREEVDPEAWSSWWWPIAALGGSAGLISVAGIIAYQSLIDQHSPRSSSPATMAEIMTQLTPEERDVMWRMIGERKIRFMDIPLLPIEELIQNIREYKARLPAATPKLTGSPEFRERARRFGTLLERRGFRARVHDFDAFSMVDYDDPTLCRLITRVAAPYDREKVRSFAFWSGCGTILFHESWLEGDLPVVVIRKPMAKGFWYEDAEIPDGIKVTELHWHTEDGLPGTHIHIEARDADLEGLARFIRALRDISEKFILSDALPR